VFGFCNNFLQARSLTFLRKFHLFFRQQITRANLSASNQCHDALCIHCILLLKATPGRQTIRSSHNTEGE